MSPAPGRDAEKARTAGGLGFLAEICRVKKSSGAERGRKEQTGKDSDLEGLVFRRLFQKASVARVERLRNNWC